jgi:two-component system copper resistance phosphate regulon response regulator CusR
VRILIVEDHPTTSSYLAKGLKEHLFIPDVAHDGKEGLYLALNNPYKLIILDVMLPHLDGWTLIKSIRAGHPHLPVLFLTARDTVEDRVKGLELGADDYLIKPFAFSELLARIRTLIRRTKPQETTDAIHIADLTIHPRQYRVTRGNQPLTLTAKEFSLLLLFAQKLGEPLSRTYIAEQVWDIHFDCDTNVIDVAIKRLRDKVDKPFNLPLIHTVRGIGYMMEIAHA